VRIGHRLCVRADLGVGVICPTGHRFSDAVRLYSEAIELNPLDATYWCNRAAARTKLEEYGFALADACKSLDVSIDYVLTYHATTAKAIEVEPKYAKAYYRYVTACG
jgi:hypothetical protein